MAKKLYKRKFTEEDLSLVENYMRRNANDIFIEVWQNGIEDGDVYVIKASSLNNAIHQASKYYDSVNAKQKVVELIMRDKSGDYIPIYHIERNREGLTNEVIKYAEEDVLWGYSISFYKGGDREIYNDVPYKTKKEALNAVKVDVNNLASLYGLNKDRFNISVYKMDC